MDGPREKGETKMTKMTKFNRPTGSKMLWFDGNRNHAVEIVDVVSGGYIVKMENGILVGPVGEHKAFINAKTN
jgi:hypothetical protein